MIFDQDQEIMEKIKEWSKPTRSEMVDNLLKKFGE